MRISSADGGRSAYLFRNDTKRLVINATNVVTAGSAGLNITASDDGYEEPFLYYGNMIHITGKQGYPSKIVLDSFGTNDHWPGIMGRQGNGAAGQLGSTVQNSHLLSIRGIGAVGNSFVESPTLGERGQVAIEFTAAQDFTQNDRGTTIDMWVTPMNTNSTILAAQVTGNGVVLATPGTHIEFGDGTTQSTSATLYNMGNVQNWTSNVFTVSDALDQLAARITALGG